LVDVFVAKKIQDTFFEVKGKSESTPFAHDGRNCMHWFSKTKSFLGVSRRDKTTDHTGQARALDILEVSA
jgi:hypothetical protein